MNFIAVEAGSIKRVEPVLQGVPVHHRKHVGIASYAKTDDQAKERTGAKPMVMKALRLAEKSKTDIVIANGDADKLRDPNTNLSFLADGKVVILVD